MDVNVSVNVNIYIITNYLYYPTKIIYIDSHIIYSNKIDKDVIENNS